VDNGFYLNGVSESPDPGSIKEAGKQAVKLIEAAYAARLEQATIIRIMEIFGKAIQGSPGLTDCSLSSCSAYGDYHPGQEDDETRASDQQARPWPDAQAD
jgi:hypothetical protein